MVMTLQWKPFEFCLRWPLLTAQTVLRKRQGWLLRLEDLDQGLGWGEVSPLDRHELPQCLDWLNVLGRSTTRADVEQVIKQGPPALAFGLGAALAELDGLVGGNGNEDWYRAPTSAQLLPSGEQAVASLECVLADHDDIQQPLTVKWKVATLADKDELRVLLRILELLPKGSKLRVDANGGWDRSRANSWVEALLHVQELQWLEQPLSVDDIEGLKVLAGQIPVALDESLRSNPQLCQSWLGWQVRRPLIDGDPRPLLEELSYGVPYRMISTAFETGIGARWIQHLSGLQFCGPTPAAPGLAPGWCPDGDLFSPDPEEVWQMA